MNTLNRHLYCNTANTIAEAKIRVEFQCNSMHGFYIISTARIYYFTSMRKKLKSVSVFDKILEINHLLKKLPISDEEDFAAPETLRILDKI